MKLFKRQKKGQVTIYLTFMIVAIFILFIAAFFAPMGVLLNSKLYEAAEMIMLDANESISNIQDDVVREQIQAEIQAGLDASQNNINVNANIFQYSWIIILALVAIVVFLFTRRMVEYGQGGFI